MEVGKIKAVVGVLSHGIRLWTGKIDWQSGRIYIKFYAGSAIAGVYHLVVQLPVGWLKKTILDLHEKVYWWKIRIRVNWVFWWLEVQYSRVIAGIGSIRKAEICFVGMGEPVFYGVSGIVVV